MLHRDINMGKWKEEQVKYFRKYLTAFNRDSREYNIIKRGIEELERSM